jgi:hypothetical protein
MNPKRRLPLTNRHNAASQKTLNFINAAVETSNIT